MSLLPIAKKSSIFVTMLEREQKSYAFLIKLEPN